MTMAIEATAIYGLGEIECQKDTAELLALAFTPKLNATLQPIISYDRDETKQQNLFYTLSLVPHQDKETACAGSSGSL
jgi:hypothetical protein